MKSVSLLAFLLFVAVASAEFLFTGTNMAFMESGKTPGRLYYDYTPASLADYTHFKTNGMNIIRLPVKWERIQPVLKGEMNMTYVDQITVSYNRTASNNMYLLLDIHNYARYRDYGTLGNTTLTYDCFYDLWYRLATLYKDSPYMMFGLMNEPNSMPADWILKGMQAGIDGVRAAGAKQLIMVPGNTWTGAWKWTRDSTNMINITDPLNRFTYEMHQYFDQYNTGRQACYPSWDPVSFIGSATTWLRNNNRTAMIGEFGIEPTSTCLPILEKFVSYLRANSDVWIGYTYWAAGPWWGDYSYSIHPLQNGTERAQMTILKKHMPKSYVDTYTRFPLPSATTSTTAAAVTTEAATTNAATTKAATTSEESSSIPEGLVSSSINLLPSLFVTLVTFFLFF